MTDHSQIQAAVAEWSAARDRDPTDFLPDRPDLHADLLDGIVQLLDAEAAGTPAPAEPDDPLPAAEPDDLLELLDPPTHPGDIGRVAGYRVSAVLGHGGMGAVFAATDAAGTPLAVKLVRSGRRAAGAVSRFRREADALRAVNHPGVVPAVAVAEHRGRPVLVMPRLVGDTLDARLRQPPPLTPGELVRLAGELADALSAVHAAGYVHRDLKPSNVWLEPGRPTRLIDFGLAKLAEGDPRLTAPGHFVGTPSFMAPEQAHGHDVDHRADLFGLGCVLYRAAAGRPAFAGKTLVQVLTSVQTDHPPAPAAVRPDLPAGLSALILHLLAKAPADRPASAGDVVRRVHAVAFELLGPPPPAAPSVARPAVVARPPRSLDGLIARLWVTPAGAGQAVAEAVLAVPGEPALYVFAADGLCRQVYPADDGTPTGRRLSVRATVGGLPPGSNAVAAVVGPAPLPVARGGWSRRLLGGEPPWRPRPDPTRGVWTHHAGRTEGDGPGDPPAGLAALAMWLAGRPGVADVAVVGFTV